MRIKLSIFAFFIIFLISLNNILSAKVNTKIILKVENEIITDYEVKNKILTSLMLEDLAVSQENINSRKKQVLNSLIQHKLKKIELSKFDFIVDENQKNSYLLSISPDGIEVLKKKFKKNNLDFKFFIEEVETQFKWQQLIYTIYSNKIEINEKSINKEIENILENKSQIEEFRISEIEIFRNDNDTDSQKKLDLIQSIKNEGFGSAASKYSISNSSAKRGDLGWINSKSLSEEIYSAIKNLKIGEVTEPINTQEGFLYLKLTDKKVSKSIDMDRAELKKNLTEQRKNKLFDLYSKSHISKLKNSSFIQYK